MSDGYQIRKVNGKPGVNITCSYLNAPRAARLSTVYTYMPSHHMHHMQCGGIWHLTQVYLEEKLAIEILLYHLPGPREIITLGY